MKISLYKLLSIYISSILHLISLLWKCKGDIQAVNLIVDQEQRKVSRELYLARMEHRALLAEKQKNNKNK